MKKCQIRIIGLISGLCRLSKKEVLLMEQFAEKFKVFLESYLPINSTGEHEVIFIPAYVPSKSIVVEVEFFSSPVIRDALEDFLKKYFENEQIVLRIFNI